MFHFRKQFFQDILFNLVEKTKQICVLPKFTNCISTTISFELWMPKGVHDIFSFIINFLGSNWQPKQVTIGFIRGNRNYWANIS
jgi:hypothetical protein